MQVFRLASCLLLQPQSSSPTSAPAVFSVLRALFSCNPAVFLETSGFFQITTPRVLFLPSQQPPRKSPKLPARRADVTAAGAHDPAALSCFAAYGFFLCRNPPAAVLFLRLPCPQCSRTLAQRPVLWLPVGTRSAELRKPHKPPTRARRRGSGVFAVHSTHVFNKIGIFPPCGILVQLLHLPVIVLLERELNWSDGEA